jgi:hypothetical protein
VVVDVDEAGGAEVVFAVRRDDLWFLTVVRLFSWLELKVVVSSRLERMMAGSFDAEEILEDLELSELAWGTAGTVMSNAASKLWVGQFCTKINLANSSQFIHHFQPKHPCKELCTLRFSFINGDGEISLQI